MSDKIRISLDEVNSLDVDRKLQQQSALARTTEHYQQHVALSMPSMVGRPGKTSVWYNTLLYMTFFGAVGGMLAWSTCEIVWQSTMRDEESLIQFLGELGEIMQDAEAGEISQAETESRLERLKVKYAGNQFVAILTDESLSETQREARIAQLVEKAKPKQLASSVIFFALGGMIIAGLLSIADAVVSRNLRDAIINGSIGLCLGMLGGIIGGLFSGRIYNVLGGGTGELGMTTQVFARSLALAVMGLFLAIGPGIVLRSAKRLMIGLAGGFLGGLLGGGLFDLVISITDAAWLSRLISFVAIGAIAGLGTGVIENIAKTGWIKVVAGLIAGKQFILYKNPTIIGSSPQCEIYLFKDVQVAPQHAAIRQLPQGYEIEDLGTGTGTFVNGSPAARVRLRNNDQIQIGGTTFLFQEKAKTRA